MLDDHVPRERRGRQAAWWSGSVAWPVNVMMSPTFHVAEGQCLIRRTPPVENCWTRRIVFVGDVTDRPAASVTSSLAVKMPPFGYDPLRGGAGSVVEGTVAVQIPRKGDGATFRIARTAPREVDRQRGYPRDHIPSRRPPSGAGFPITAAGAAARR